MNLTGYEIDAIVWAYYSTVNQLLKENKIDDAVKVANQFMEISNTLVMKGDYENE